MVIRGYKKSFIIFGSRLKPFSSAADSVKSFSISPYITGTAEPTKRALNNYDIKVALQPYKTQTLAVIVAVLQSAMVTLRTPNAECRTRISFASCILSSAFCVRQITPAVLKWAGGPFPLGVRGAFWNTF